MFRYVSALVVGQLQGTGGLFDLCSLYVETSKRNPRVSCRWSRREAEIFRSNN